MFHPHCILNGQPKEIKSKLVDISDLGFLRGYGIFDYLRTQNGVPFLLDNHIKRLIRSAGFIGLELKYSFAEIKEQTFQALKLNSSEGEEFAIRYLASGGPSPDGYLSHSDSQLIILIETPPKYNLEEISIGVKLIADEYFRDFCEAKTTNYINSVRLQPRMKAKGAVEILYHKNGVVSECSRSNIFAFFGEKLVTPKKDILLGNTRGLVLELAENNFEIAEQELTYIELLSADEVFITGTGKKITPVRAIENKEYGAPGENTKKLIRSFELYEKELSS